MISKEQIKKILVYQRKYILSKDLGVARDVLANIKKKKTLPHVVVLTGLRRSGKSTALRQIISNFYDDEDFHYINFEDERLLSFKAEDFEVMHESLIELFGKKKTFFIDEIQNISFFENFVRRLYDEGYKFYITGSNAKLLSHELGTKLTGRYVEVKITPFSFKEFLVFRKFKFVKNFIYDFDSRMRLKKLFREYMKKGGMPEYLRFKDDEILVRTYENIVSRDIFVRHKIDNTKQVKELYQYLISNFANIFSYNFVKNVLGFKSVNSVRDYIGYFEETHFVKMINRFEYGLKKQLMSKKKIYLVDNGFIPLISTRFTKDYGWVLENLVFNALLVKGSVYYFQEKGECDFLVVEKKKVKEVVQVTWELNDHNRDREINGLVEAMKKFKLKEGLILTMDDEEEFVVGKKKIRVVPVWKWLFG